MCKLFIIQNMANHNSSILSLLLLSQILSTNVCIIVYIYLFYAGSTHLHRPISLCNSVFKIISKVIANHIKPFLSRALSLEQFGFLEGHQIHDAIGNAHECIHNIKKKNKKVLILKLDLQKSYDCVNWDFLRLILIQGGFGVMLTNWIMSCVSSASFVVLVNDEATNFFRSG
jgi:hypothetical protein